jgi:hypothetical protein
MKGPLAVLIASTIFLNAGLSSEALAQKRRVVIEQFRGPGADRLRVVIWKGVARQGIEVLSDKKVAAVEADLGLIKVSDSYAAAGRELKVNGFISGTVTGGRRPKARMVVRSAEGTVLGAQNWMGANMGKLLKAVNANAGQKASAMLGTAAGGGAPPRKELADEPVAAEEPASKAEPEAAAEEPVASAEDETPRSRKRSKAADDEEKSSD